MNLYIIGGIALIMSVMAGLIYYYRAEMLEAEVARITAEADKVRAVDANVAAQKTIDALRAQQIRNDKLLAELAQDISAIREGADETNEALDRLEKNSEDVKAFLAGAVPTELRQLLNQR